MKKKILSIFAATMISVGAISVPALAVENNIPELEQNVNQEFKEVEIVGTIRATSTCWDPRNNYTIYSCDKYTINADAVERLAISDYRGEKVRIKGRLINDGTIDPVEIEVLEQEIPEEAEETEIVGTIYWNSTPHYSTCFCDEYLIDADAAERLSMYEYNDKKVKIKGYLVNDKVIVPVEVNVLE